MKNWNDVVRENAASVLSAALRITGNLADAEDVSQEVFVEAYRKSSLQPSDELGGLLRRMSVCRAIDLLRSKKRAESLPAQLPDRSSPTAHDQLATREIESRLRSIIGELPPREAQVFCLVHFEQQSHSEIATALSISKSAVAKSLSMARTNIESKFSGVFRRDACPKTKPTKHTA